MPMIHLPIKRKWFDMILSGEKTEEYREIKEYWAVRLFGFRLELEPQALDEMVTDLKDVHRRHAHLAQLLDYFEARLKVDRAILKNGYQKDARSLIAGIAVVEVGRGNPEWGAPKNRDVFILKLSNPELVKHHG